MNTHFFYCPFTGLGLKGGYRGDSWLKNRIQVFKNFTLQSLLNQQTQDFVLWVSWREEDRRNKVVQELFEYLRIRVPFRFIFTYHGVCFWDDKYDDLEAERRLYVSLMNTLPEIAQYCEDTVYMTIQPSDDMYFGDLVKEVKEFDGGLFKHRAFGYMHGYIMNYATKEICEYNPNTIPPFFTIRFPKDIFLDPKDHMQYASYKSHEYIRNIGFSGVFERKFVVGTHGENISTTWNHPYKGPRLSEGQSIYVMEATGTLNSDCVIIRTNIRLLARKMLNLLPFGEKIRSVYKKLPTKYQKL